MTAPPNQAPASLLWFDRSRQHFFLIPQSAPVLGGPYELLSMDGRSWFVDPRQVQAYEVSREEARTRAQASVDRVFESGVAASNESAGAKRAHDLDPDGQQLFAVAQQLLQRLGTASSRDQQTLFGHLQELLGSFDPEELVAGLHQTGQRLSQRSDPLDLESLVSVVQEQLDEELASREPQSLNSEFAANVRTEARKSIQAALRKRGFEVDEE